MDAEQRLLWTKQIWEIKSAVSDAQSDLLTLSEKLCHANILLEDFLIELSGIMERPVIEQEAPEELPPVETFHPQQLATYKESAPVKLPDQVVTATAEPSKKKNILEKMMRGKDKDETQKKRDDTIAQLEKELAELRK
jgi:hypothetical protein